MYVVYSTFPAARADLDAVNAAFVAAMAGGPQAHVTQRWADIVQCVEGWAFPLPPSNFHALCSGTWADSITPTNSYA